MPDLQQISFVFLCLFVCIHQTVSNGHEPVCQIRTLEEQGMFVKECLPDKTMCNVTCKTDSLTKSWRQCVEAQWQGPPLICAEDDTEDKNTHFIKKRDVTCMFNGCVPPATNRGSEPVLRCPSNIEQIADPFQTHAKVTWVEPSATDDRDGKITPKRYGLGPGQLFSEGTNTVGYSARDRAGNMASCTFKIKIEVVRCKVPEQIQDGWRICHPPTDFVRSAVCEAGCYGGHDLTGAERFNCLVSGRWSDSTPVCNKKKCPDLNPSPTGHVSIQCTDKYYYRSKCTYVCDKGYGVASGKSRVQVCQEDGSWRGSRPVCLDIERPELSLCPNNIVKVLDKGSNLITVNWIPPFVKDNSRESIKPVLEKGLPPGSKFNVGTHVIEYSAKDSSGNIAKPCQFKVVIREILCHTLYPTVYQAISCPDGYKRGSICNFTCAANTDLDSEAHSTECMKTNTRGGPAYGVWSFGKIQPVCEVTSMCPDLAAPENGALVCDNWYGGALCQLQCKSDYDLPRENRSFQKHELLVCGTSGKWNNDATFPSKVPKQCSRRRWRGSSRLLLMRPLFYFNGNCEDPSTQATIKKNFINLLDEKGLCSGINGCVSVNVKILCGKSRKKRSETATEEDVVNSAEITVIVNSIENDTEDNVTSRTETVIRNLVNLRNKTFSVNNETVSVYVTSRPVLSLSCPDGFIPATDSVTCTPCQTGSFHNKTADQCSKCPKGYFQSKEGQTECIECPEGSTTVSEGSNDMSLCERGCPPGFISGTGISPCSPCPIGEYQPETGKTSCIQCPGSRVTDIQGAMRISQCSDFDIQSLLTANKSVAEVALEKPEVIQEISLCFWVRCSECTNVVSLLDETSSPFLHMSVENHWATFTIGSRSFNFEMKSPASKWYFVSVSLTKDTLKIWKGEQLEINENSNFTSHNFTTVQLGGEGFIGFISQFNIWNKFKDFKSAPMCDNIVSGNLVAWRDFARAGLENSFIDIPSSCDDTDNCKSQPCANNAVCEDSLDDVVCTCLDGFGGKYCHINLNDCLEDVCMNNGTCVDDVNDYHCDCPSGYSGKYCEIVKVDGGWTEYGNWSTCSVTCGNGTRSRKRMCDNPSPDNGGKNCEGDNIETEECSLPECKVCEEIEEPENGYLTCVNASDTVRCQVGCDAGYMSDIPPLKEYICGTSTFYEWNYHSVYNPYKRLPYCSKVRPATTLEVTFTGVYYQVDCNKPGMVDEFTTRVKQEVNLITSKLNCVKMGNCEVVSAIVELCDNDASRPKRSVGNTDDAVIGVTIMAIHNLDSSEKVKKLTQAVTNLETSVENGEFDIKIDENIYRLNKNDTKSIGKAGCPDGSWSYDAFCVPCGMGSYMNDGRCDLCDFGQYTDEEGQTSCKACPNGRTTRGIGARHHSECDVPVKVPSSAGLPGVYIGLIVLFTVLVVVMIAVFLILLRKRYCVKKTDVFAASAYELHKS